MVQFIFFSLVAFASVTPGELRCLDALAEFEFGKEKQFAEKKNATVISAKVANTFYAWDGVSLFQFSGIRLEVDSAPARIEGVTILNSSEYLSGVGKKEVWSQKKTENLNPAAEQAMRSILKQSFYTFLKRLRHEPSAAITALKEKVGGACSDVELTIPGSGKGEKTVVIKDEAKKLMPAEPIGNWETTVSEPASGASEAK